MGAALAEPPAAACARASLTATEMRSVKACACAQVTGFVVNPDQPGKRFVDGVLVSY